MLRGNTVIVLRVLLLPFLNYMAFNFEHLFKPATLPRIWLLKTLHKLAPIICVKSKLIFTRIKLNFFYLSVPM